jgi:putative hydrolase of the HAD superfamily
MSGVPTCVVFDLDDTVYLERDYVRSGFRAVGDWAAAELGVIGFSDRAWACFEAGARGTVFDEVLRACGVEPTPDGVAALVEVYRRHEPDIELLPDAAAVIEELSRRVALGVVTDGPIESQRAKARALTVDRWSQAAVFTAELGEGFGKPHPRAFEEVQRQVGAAGDQCVYVADNPVKDFAGPRTLGWATVRVRRAGSLHAAAASGTDVDLELAELRSLPARLDLSGG